MSERQDDPRSEVKRAVLLSFVYALLARLVCAQSGVSPIADGPLKLAS